MLHCNLLVGINITLQNLTNEKLKVSFEPGQCFSQSLEMLAKSQNMSILPSAKLMHILYPKEEKIALLLKAGCIDQYYSPPESSKVYITDLTGIGIVKGNSWTYREKYEPFAYKFRFQ